jgi:hypothetical protein
VSRIPGRTSVTGTLAAVMTAGPAAQQLRLADVLSHLDSYLERYEVTVATVVAEEHYSQTYVPGAQPGEQSRTLRSDYALARAPGGQAWSGFRDTYEVDGRPVRDREHRLLALLSQGSAASAQQALRITRENARYNLGSAVVTRTINVPTVALDLIHRRHRSRFAFARSGDEIVDGISVWILSFRERGRPTIVRTPDGRDRRTAGRVWVEPQSGEVLRTELSWEGPPRSVIVVEYRRDEGIGARVPIAMTEEYRSNRGMVSATAAYANYRRFQTAARIVPGAP